jgi:hypothetical protein
MIDEALKEYVAKRRPKAAFRDIRARIVPLRHSHAVLTCLSPARIRPDARDII